MINIVSHVESYGQTHETKEMDERASVSGDEKEQASLACESESKYTPTSQEIMDNIED